MTSYTNRFGQNNQIKFIQLLLINLTIEIDQNGPKCYADVVQQKCNNNRYYASTLKYYID